MIRRWFTFRGTDVLQRRGLSCSQLSWLRKPTLPSAPQDVRYTGACCHTELTWPTVGAFDSRSPCEAKLSLGKWTSAPPPVRHRPSRQIFLLLTASVTCPTTKSEDVRSRAFKARPSLFQQEADLKEAHSSVHLSLVLIFGEGPLQEFAVEKSQIAYFIS